MDTAFIGFIGITLVVLVTLALVVAIIYGMAKKLSQNTTTMLVEKMKEYDKEHERENVKR
ncbi:MAG: hypothetical protein ACXAEN_19385 [Candidatus Thorarchaeota archaeon]|jgi:hypothetical protein